MPQTALDTHTDADTLPLQQFLTYRLSRVQAKLNAQATRILREASGITLTQWRIIALVGAAGQTRLSQLAREAALDKNTKALHAQSRAYQQSEEKLQLKQTVDRDLEDQEYLWLELTEKIEAASQVDPG